MALATRCPQCGTAFRLVADQLRLHDGLVRCGACSAIFDGRQNQFDVDSGALPGPADVAPAPPAPRTPPVTPAPDAAPTPPAPAVSVPSPVSALTLSIVDAPPPAPVTPPIPERLPESEPREAAAGRTVAPQEPSAAAETSGFDTPAQAERAPASAPAPDTLAAPVDPALLGPATRLVLPPSPPEPEPPAPSARDVAPPAPAAGEPTPPPPPTWAAPTSPLPAAGAPTSPPAAGRPATPASRIRPFAPSTPASPAATPTPLRAPGESGIRELGAGGVGIRELAPRGSGPRATPPSMTASRGREPVLGEPSMSAEPRLPNRDLPDVGADTASAHGPGAREPSLHEPLPLAPSGDANLLHAPQSFAARDVPDAADSRREPRFVAPVALADPREPGVSPIRASVIDDGLPTPRLRTRADGSIPDLQARLRADADAEAAASLDVPELRRESADPTALEVPEAPAAPAEPIYAWDPATEDTDAPEPLVTDAPGPRMLDEPDEPRAPRRMWPWVLGILVAALVLGAQATYVWRDEIATDFPITRPLLSSVCAPFGCTVGYPRHPELLSIESSALEPWQNDPNAGEAANAPNRLALRVVLRNRHTQPQPWPSIELTLTDLSDNAVVRRVLSPSDYLPADTVTKPMPPRSERSLRVPVDPPAEAVSGYRLSVFFP